MNYEISLSTSQHNKGLLGTLVNSVISSEGVVLKFSGSGKVIICSRNINSFAAWVASQRQAA